MKKFAVVTTCLLSLSLFLSGFSFPDSVSPKISSTFSCKRPVIEENDQYVDHEIIVVAEASVEASSLQVNGISENVSVLMSDLESNTFRVILDESVNMNEALDTYADLSFVLFAQPNYKFEKIDSLLSDGQVQSQRQWHHKIIHTKEAWELMDKLPSRGCTKVAVIEGAVDINHPDLRENIDLEQSCSLANGYKEPITSATSNDHSTHVAGIIAAVSDNGFGTEGVASGTKNDCVEIVSINIIKEDNKLLSSDTIISALQYAVKCGCRVINMSFGGYGKNLAIENAVNSAFNSGAVVVCAAGNDNSTRYGLPSDASEAISVINLAYYGNKLSRSPLSDYGEYKDISAPGTNILSTKTGNIYGLNSGTSMAAPMVSGVAALIYSTNPSLTAAQVRRMIIWTAKDLGSVGWDKDTANGCVDAYQAVYIALWMRDFKLLPEEKKTFSDEIEPLETTLDDLIVLGKFESLSKFLFSANSYCGNPIEFSESNVGKYVLSLASGDMTACGLFNELVSKSSVTRNNADYFFFVYNLFLNRVPTVEEENAGYNTLLLANGREVLADQLLHSEEFIKRCNESFVTPGDGLTIYK